MLCGHGFRDADLADELADAIADQREAWFGHTRIVETIERSSRQDMLPQGHHTGPSTTEAPPLRQSLPPTMTFRFRGDRTTGLGGGAESPAQGANRHDSALR
jgi:hypothetical protein